MEASETNLVKLKFEKLKADLEVIFTPANIKGMGWWKEDAFQNQGFRSFYDNLEKEIPNNPYSIIEIDKWLQEIDKYVEELNIKVANVNPKIQYPTPPIHLKYRRIIKAKLIDIKILLANNSVKVEEKAGDNVKPVQLVEDLSEKESYLPASTLSVFFESPKKYDQIINLLVSKGYCQASTLIWKDETKGNKGLLAAILKYLHKQGYLKGNKKLTIEQIQEIALNPFGWELSIDTIKKAKPEQFDLTFIPPASALP